MIKIILKKIIADVLHRRKDKKGTIHPNDMKNETRIDYRERIKKVTRYIDDHIYDSLRLKDLSAIACFSEYHFHRVFVACLGMTVQEYISVQRLSKAAILLLKSNYRITDIALETGYETVSSFTQTFKKYFNTTPSRFRQIRGSAANSHIPGVNNPIEYLKNQLASRKLRSEKIPYEIREIPDMKAITVTKKGFYDGAFLQAAASAFSEMYEYVDRHRLHDAVGYRLSIVPFVPYEFNDPDAVIHCGYSLKEDVKPEGDARVHTLCGGKYAVFANHGPYEYIYQTWGSAYFTCVLADNEQIRNVTPFEIYFNSPRDTKPQDLRMELYLPIE